MLLLRNPLVGFFLDLVCLNDSWSGQIEILKFSHYLKTGRFYWNLVLGSAYHRDGPFEIVWKC